MLRRIGTLIIGRNPNWEQRVNLGWINNQKFVGIPHVVLQGEGYSSKCSFLDGEFSEMREEYAGKRIRRGLFQTADGRLISVDVNVSYNIITKAFPKAIAGIEGVVVHPVRVML